MSMPWIYKLEFIMINSCISSTFFIQFFYRMKMSLLWIHNDIIPTMNKNKCTRCVVVSHPVSQSFHTRQLLPKVTVWRGCG